MVAPKEVVTRSPGGAGGLVDETVSPTYRIVLGTSAPGRLQSLTQRRDDLVVEAYPMSPHLVLQASGRNEDLEEAMAVLHRGTGTPLIREEGRVTLVLEEGESAEEVARVLADRDARVVPPIRWVRGEAQVTLLVDDAFDLREVEALFPDARLLSKRALAEGTAAQDALRSPLFLSSLTQKQAETMETAYDAGYYDFPRRATLDDISRARGSARSTFQEHLHKAERHVVRALLPFVRIRAAGPGGEATVAGEALSLYSRFSGELGLYVQLEVLDHRVRRVRLRRDPPADASSSHPYLERILEHLRTGKEDLGDIPLDLQVGPFEREVLAFLRELPPGETITYGEIARRLGRPKAARAVGRACARNPVPLIVPCHRVLPASGGVGNYSAEGGAETKRALLRREHAEVPEEPEA
ncbi:MAG: methylated-DNA--[protein]-cysteine S-methyltransferase [Thermoplasmata archaeon]|nr:methylated-DNA--[protein]-cysteine S-methyltransferase [Thermoplasmata archaeon]